MTNNQFKIFTLRVANELVDRGFEIVGTRINAKEPRFRVYLFDDTEEFRAALAEILMK